MLFEQFLLNISTYEPHARKIQANYQPIPKKKNVSKKANFAAYREGMKIINADLQFGAQILYWNDMNELTESTEQSLFINLITLVESVNPLPYFDWFAPHSVKLIGMPKRAKQSTPCRVQFDD